MKKILMNFYPPIIAIIFYHGKAKWGYSLEFIDLFNKALPEPIKQYLPNYKHVLCDMSALKDEEIKGNILTMATLWLFKHIFDDDLFEQLPKTMGLLADLANKETALEYIETVLRYLGSAANFDQKKLHSVVQMTIPTTGEGIMTAAVEEWAKQGKTLAKRTNSFSLTYFCSICVNLRPSAVKKYNLCHPCKI